MIGHLTCWTCGIVINVYAIVYKGKYLVWNYFAGSTITVIENERKTCHYD